MATTTWHQHQIEPLMASTVYFRGYIQVPLQFTSEVFIATISMILLTCQTPDDAKRIVAFHKPLI